MIKFDYIDHISYVFHSIEDGYEFFKDFSGFRIIKGQGINSHTKMHLKLGGSAKFGTSVDMLILVLVNTI